MKINILILFAFFTSFVGSSQSKTAYNDAYLEINSLFESIDSSSFKKAVFAVENAYFDGDLDLVHLEKSIQFLTNLAVGLNKDNQLSSPEEQKFLDSEKIEQGAGIFLAMKDTVPVIYNGELVHHMPMTYDFEDMFGDDDWTKMFVSKLLATNSGNCHSFPYLYKIIANEIGFDVSLSLAPNHIYVKTFSQRYGWFNIELTSGTFPLDSWLMASGFVTMDAIRSGLYMRALDEKESVALCLIDLAMGYKNRFPKADNEFPDQCIKLALEHFPDYINALLLRAETHKELLQKNMNKLSVSTIEDINVKNDLLQQFQEVENEFSHIMHLGYRQMPKQMYVDWLALVEQEKYSDKREK